MENIFSKPSDLLYFNSANLSICPNPVLNAIDFYRRQFEINPTQSLKESWEQLWNVQSELAYFLGADPLDLILRTNVTEVLNTFILGIPMVRGEEILVGELEYGAIANICRFRAERDNLNLRVLKLPQSQPALTKLTSAKLVELVTSQFTPQTKIVVLSHVLASLGLKLPVETLAEVTRQKKIKFIVDGAYAPGALPIDFSRLKDIDFYGCSLYKWLLGPKGTAFGWIHPNAQETLVPIQAGWTTFESRGDFNHFGEGSRFQEKFQLFGCRDFSPFYALEELFKLWHSMGPETIRNHIFQLNELFQMKLQKKLGWGVLSPGDLSLAAPITVFRLPEKVQPHGHNLSQYVLNELKLQLQFTQLSTGWHGIFSPHIYNSDTEVETAVSRLMALN